MANWWKEYKKKNNIDQEAKEVRQKSSAAPQRTSSAGRRSYPYTPSDETKAAAKSSTWWEDYKRSNNIYEESKAATERAKNLEKKLAQDKQSYEQYKAAQDQLAKNQRMDAAADMAYAMVRNPWMSQEDLETASFQRSADRYQRDLPLYQKSLAASAYSSGLHDQAYKQAQAAESAVKDQFQRYQQASQKAEADRNEKTLVNRPAQWQAENLSPQEIQRRLAYYRSEAATPTVTDKDREARAYLYPDAALQKDPHGARFDERLVEDAGQEAVDAAYRPILSEQEQEAVRQADQQILADKAQSNYEQVQILTAAQKLQGESYSRARGQQLIDEIAKGGEAANRVKTGKAMLDEQQARIAADTDVEIKDDLESSRGAYTASQKERQARGYILGYDWDKVPEEQKQAVYALFTQSPQQAIELAKYYIADVRQAEDEQRQAWYAQNALTAGVGLVASAGAHLAAAVDPFGEVGQELTRRGDNALTGGARWADAATGYQKIPEWVPIVGGKGAGDFYQTVGSVVQSAAIAAPAVLAGRYDKAAAEVVSKLGLALMGSSAAASDYRESVAAGMDDDRAKLHALAAGVEEALFEEVSLDKLVSMDTSGGFKALVRNWLVQSGVEGSEELTTGLANRITDELISGAGQSKVERRTSELIANGMSATQAKQQAESEWLTDTLYEGFSGFLSGGMMTGGNYALKGIANLKDRAVNAAVNREAQRQAGAAVSRSEGSVEALQAYAKDKGIEIKAVETATQNEEQNAGESAEQVNQDGKRNSYSSRDYRSISDTNSKVMQSIRSEVRGKTVQEQQTIRDNLVEKYGEGIAPVVNNAISVETAARVRQEYGSVDSIQAARNQAVSEIQDESLRRAVSDGYDSAAYSLAASQGGEGGMDTMSRYIQQRRNTGTGSEMSMEATVAAQDGSTKTIAITGLSEDGKHVSLADGSEVSVKDLQADADTTSVIQQLADLDLGADATKVLQAYQQRGIAGTDGYRWLMDYATAYNQGRTRQISLEQAAKRSSLDERTVMDAYTLGQQAANRETQAGLEKLKNLPKRKGASGRTANIDTTEIKGKTMSKSELEQFELANQYAQALGVDMTWFSSREKDGKFVDKNGAYENGKIYMDIHAGRNFTADLTSGILATMGHELTHFQQQYAPEEYQAIKEFLFEQIVKSSPNGEARLERLIWEKQKRSGYTLSRKAAEDEVVADACQKMLRDSKAVHDFANQQPEAANGIVRWLDKWFKKVRSIFGRGGNYSEEAQLMDSLEQDVKAAFGELWDKALKQAAKVHDEVGNIENATTEGESKAQNSDRDTEYLDAIEKKEDWKVKKMVRDAAVQWGAATDERGKPIPLYHGTPRFGFTVFKDPAHEVPFIYTSTNPTVSAHYAGDKNYAGRRPIGRKYRTGTKTEDIIENAKWVYESNYHVMSTEEKLKAYKEIEKQAIEIADKLDEVHIGAWNAESEAYKNMPDEVANAISWVEDMFWTIRDSDYKFNFDGKEDYPGERAEFFKVLDSDIENAKTQRAIVQEFYDENKKNLSKQEKAFLSYLLSYEVGDAATDIEYKLRRVATENDVIMNEAGNINNPLDLKESMDMYHEIGAYTLYGNLGDNPFIFDANGAQFWGVKVPEMGDGYYSTDSISKWAYENGYTGVVMKNIYDYGDKADNYVFFNSSQLKSADPVTYDDDGNVIPLSERFNEENQDIRYSYRGVNAETADLTTLKRAKEMLSNGTDSETVRKETGWFRGMDGKWRFEINDSNVRVDKYGDLNGRIAAYNAFQKAKEALAYDAGTSLEIELKKKATFEEDVLTAKYKDAVREKHPRTAARIYKQLSSSLGTTFTQWADAWRTVEEFHQKYGYGTFKKIVSDYIDAAELFKAYPRLAEIPVQWEDFGDGSRGMYNGRSIMLDRSLRSDPDQMKSTLLHELQHAVQEIEGFARGSSPEYWRIKHDAQMTKLTKQVQSLSKSLDAMYADIGYEDYYNDLERRAYVDEEITPEEMDRLLDEYVKEHSPNYGYPLLQQYKKALDAYHEAQKDGTPFEMYQRTAGEIESRDVQNRMGFTDEERRNNRPDIDRKDVVFTENANVTLDSQSESAAPMDGLLYSERTWSESRFVRDRENAAKALAKALNVSVRKAVQYIDDINSVAKAIADDRARLDYMSSPGRSAFKSNAEYGGSIDFSTLCKKRQLLTGTFNAIQHALANTVLTAEDVLRIRQMMQDAGLEVNCGMCYVEGSRARMGEYNKTFLELYQKYFPDNWQPKMEDVNTTDGLELMRMEHPECYEQYEHFYNNHGTLRSEDKAIFSSQAKPKEYQLRTEYKGEIAEKFQKDSTVEAKNLNGGLRMQSFSDFEIVHLIDCMQVIMDMSEVGLAGQAYTKVPEFAEAMGKTGLKINLSLVAKGVDENGKLIFNDVEGMPHERAFGIREKYSENVGTILVVYDDAQLDAAMADDKVDFIIPFHRSQWRKSQYAAMGLPKTTKDYTYQQNEKWLNPKAHTHEYRGKTVPTKCTNYMPNEYWDFSLSGKQNAEKYLEMCANDGKRPKFYKLLQNNGDGTYSLKADGSTNGYWKLLIDFKMYDNDGVGVPQQPVQPIFDMDNAMQMLGDYNGDPSRFPVAEGIVDEFVSQYKAEHPGRQYSERDYSTPSDEELLMNASVEDAESPEARAALQNSQKQARQIRDLTRRLERLQTEIRGYEGDSPNRISVQRFTRQALDLFGIPAGVRTDMGELLQSVAEGVLAGHNLSQNDIMYFFETLIANGREKTVADETLAEIRDDLKGRKIYVNENVKAEFGDDWNAFRKRAFSFGIQLTNNEKNMGIDSVNAELAELYPGKFDADETDLRAILENIVDTAESGKTSNVPILDAMREIQKQTGEPVREQLQTMLDQFTRQIEIMQGQAAVERKARAGNAAEIAKARKQINEAKEALREVRKQRDAWKRKSEGADARQKRTLDAAMRNVIQHDAKQIAEAVRQKQALAEKLQDQIDHEKKILSGELRSPELAKLLKAEREKAEARVKEQKEQVFQNYKERKKAGELRRRIVRHSKELYGKLTKPSDKRHIPEAYRGAVAALLNTINLESAYDIQEGTKKESGRGGKHVEKGAGIATNRTKAFQEVRKQLEQVLAEGGFTGELINNAAEGFDGGLIEKCQEFADKPISALSSEELETLWHTIRALEHNITTFNKAFALAKTETISGIADKFLASAQKRKPLLRDPKNRLDLTVKKTGGLAMKALENPYTFFSHYGEEGVKLYRALRDTQDLAIVRTNHLSDLWVRKMADILSDEKTAKLNGDKLTDAILDKIRDASKQMDEKVETFRLANGQTIKLTHAMLMDVYLLAQRGEVGMNHLLGSGLIQPEIRAKGKYVARDPSFRKLSLQDVQKMTAVITENATEKAIADAIQSMQHQLADWGNEASMDVFGYRKFTEANYWPVKNAKEENKSDSGKGGNQPANAMNKGMAKNLVPHAATGMEPMSAFTKLQGSISDMLVYATWGPVMEDFKRFYNWKWLNPEGGTSDTVKGVMERYGGEGSQRYWEELRDQINNGVGGGKSFVDQFIGKAVGVVKGARVAFNLRVVAQQPTAYARAAEVISGKYLAASLLDIKSWGWKAKSAWNRALTHSPIAMRKDSTTYDMGGNISAGGEFGLDRPGRLDKARDFGTALAGKADAITWGRLWHAAELQVSAKTDLEYGSQEYWDAVNKLFTDAVDRTQVVDGLLQRPAIMRTDSDFVKGATSYMGEPLMQLNMLIRQVNDFRQTGFKATKKQIGKTVTALVVTQLINAMLTGLYDAGIRKDDEDKDFWERFMAEITGLDGTEENAWDYITSVWLESNVASEVSVMQKIPLLKDVLSMLQGYDPSNNRMDLEAIKDLIDVCTNVLWNDKYTPLHKAKEIINKSSMIFGAGFGNALKDMYGATRNIVNDFGKPKARFDFKALWLNPASKKNKSQYFDLLFQMLENGDKNAFRQRAKKLAGQDGMLQFVSKAAIERYLTDGLSPADVWDMMEAARDDGVSDEKFYDYAHGRMADAFKESYFDQKLEDDQAITLLMQYAGKNEKDAWNAVRKWKDQAKHVGADGKLPDDYKWNQYGDLSEAVANGEDVAGLLTEYRNHGYTETQINGALRDSIKDAMASGGLSEDEAADALIRYGVTYSKDGQAVVYDKQSAWKKVQEWAEKAEHTDEEGELEDGYKYSAYSDLFEVVDANQDAEGVIKEMVQNGGYDADSLRGQIKEHLRERFIAGEITETALKNQLSRYCKIVNTKDVNEIVANTKCKRDFGAYPDDLKEAFKDGDLSQNQAVKALQQYKGLSKTDAQNRVQYWGYDGDLSENAWLKWNKDLKGSGLSVENWEKVSKVKGNAKGIDANGDGRADSGTVKDEVVSYIDSMDIPKSQKKAIYLAFGWAASTMPSWH